MSLLRRAVFLGARRLAVLTARPTARYALPRLALALSRYRKASTQAATKPQGKDDSLANTPLGAELFKILQERFAVQEAKRKKLEQEAADVPIAPDDPILLQHRRIENFINNRKLPALEVNELFPFYSIEDIKEREKRENQLAAYKDKAPEYVQLARKIRVALPNADEAANRKRVSAASKEIGDIYSTAESDEELRARLVEKGLFPEINATNLWNRFILKKMLEHPNGIGFDAEALKPEFESKNPEVGRAFNKARENQVAFLRKLNSVIPQPRTTEPELRAHFEQQFQELEQLESQPDWNEPFKQTVLDKRPPEKPEELQQFREELKAYLTDAAKFEELKRELARRLPFEGYVYGPVAKGATEQFPVPWSARYRAIMKQYAIDTKEDFFRTFQEFIKPEDFDMNTRVEGFRNLEKMLDDFIGTLKKGQPGITTGARVPGKVFTFQFDEEEHKELLEMRLDIHKNTDGDDFEETHGGPNGGHKSLTADRSRGHGHGHGGH